MSIGILKVNTDSGWDVDYGSGSSYSDSYHSNKHNNNYSESSSINPANAVFLITFFSIFTILVIIQEKHRNPKNNGFDSNSIKDIDENKLKSIDGTLIIEDLKKQVFQIYENIQNAWMNFNYEE